MAMEEESWLVCVYIFPEQLCDGSQVISYRQQACTRSGVKHCVASVPRLVLHAEMHLHQHQI
jgi:hypothetical protein